MVGEDILYAVPPAKTGSAAPATPCATGATARTPVIVAAAPRKAKPKIVLDMGEASRLEGFRLNGCR